MLQRYRINNSTKYQGKLIWIILTLALTSAWPSMMQQFSVSPNEFVKEKEYLEKALAKTRD